MEQDDYFPPCLNTKELDESLCRGYDSKTQRGSSSKLRGLKVKSWGGQSPSLGPCAS